MPFSKRGFFWALLVLAIIFASELGSFLTLSLIKKEWYGYRDLSRTQIERSHRDAIKLPEVPVTAHHAGTVLHPYLGYVSDVGSQHDTGADRIPLTTLGFLPRSGEFVRKKNPNEIVIGIFGGSVARNVGWDSLPRLTALLQKDPRFVDKEITYSISAIGGYKQPQQLIAFAYLLSMGAQFDIVITLDGFNEMTLPGRENTPAGIHPLYPRSWHLLSGELSRRELRLVGTLVLHEERRSELARIFHTAPLRWSMSVGFLWHLLDHLESRAILRAHLDVLEGGSTEEDFARTGPKVTFTDHDAYYDYLAEEWKRSTDQMWKLGTTQGMTFAHFLQPSPYLKNSKPLAPEEKNCFGEKRGPRRGRSVDIRTFFVQQRS